MRLVSCDTARSGAIEQLRGFAQGEIGHEVEIAPGKAELAALGPTDGATLLIDTGGINPYSPADRQNLEACAQAAKAEPILVLAAGGDSADTVEAAHCFRDIGCQRFLAVRLDVVQRLGSLMAVPEARSGRCHVGRLARNPDYANRKRFVEEHATKGARARFTCPGQRRGDKARERQYARRNLAPNLW